MTTVNQTSLPGVGMRYDFKTKAGDEVGVIAHYGGHYDFLVYDKLDPDSCALTLPLDVEDAHTLTELLGGSQVAESQQELLQTLPGLIIDWVPVREGWSCTGQSIREIGVRARTGASIVAVVRDGETIPSPEADFVMRPGDTAVVVGTVDGIRKTVELLQGTN
jgi:TrkA domain protein